MDSKLHSIEIKILNPLVRSWPQPLPEKGTPGAAGYDLRACLEKATSINPGETLFVYTGIAVHMKTPEICAMILSRSGLGTKKGLVVKQGVGLIDSDYQGELIVALHNISHDSQTVEPGDRIAQLVFTPVIQTQWSLVESFTDASHRGAGGFGSTGS